MHKLLELHQLALQEAEKFSYKREIYPKILSQEGKHFIGVVGPRGVGKTILLKQLAKEIKNSLYISVDTLEEENLFEVIKKLNQNYKIQKFLLDEIHFQSDFEGHLKKVYDFLDVRIVFTSSVSLSMIRSAHDLSRRVELLYLYPFSFRQFLFFKKGISIFPLTLKNITDGEWTPEHLQYDYLLEEYLKGGTYPFSITEVNVLPLLKNILQKIIQEDIPKVANLKVEELRKIEKTIEFIAKSSVDGINFSSVSQNVGVTKYKAEEYLNLLEKAFVINLVWPTGTNVLKEPKVLMYLPFRLLYRSYEEALGALREDFFGQAMKICEIPFYYLKTTRGTKTPDFFLGVGNQKWVFEIGGKGKGRTQFKGVQAEHKLVLVHGEELRKGQTPLSLVGMM